jgi:hypothetical protein
MCIASPILVMGSVNGSQNVYCFSDYCQRLWHMYSSIWSESRSERWDLLIFIFILKTTGAFTPAHSAGYLILRSEFRSTQEVARQNIQVSFYIRSMGLWPNTWIHVSQSFANFYPIYTQILLNCRTPLDPPVCINMHPFLMYTWSMSCILITY